MLKKLVYDAMFESYAEGVERRALCKKKKKTKGLFSPIILSPGLLVDPSIHSLDGHDKLMVYQDKAFSIAVYGCIDIGSKKSL